MIDVVASLPRLRIVRLSKSAIPWKVHRNDAVGWPCPYCWSLMTFDGWRRPTWDHVVPIARGGVDNLSNKIAACSRCNNDKTDLMLTEFAGSLAAKRDRRAVPVTQFLLWLSSDWGDADVIAELHTQVWEAYADVVRGRSISTYPGTNPTGGVREYVPRILRELRVPERQWRWRGCDTIAISVNERVMTLVVLSESYFRQQLSFLGIHGARSAMEAVSG